MLRKILVLTVLLIFVAGTFSAMAGGNDKNATQDLYDWFSGWGKSAGKSTEICCKACGKACCAACNMDCGGKCCADCGKK